MKRKFFLILSIISSLLYAQEPPVYYHYLLNKSYINPAFIGSEMKATVRLADMHSHLFKSNMPNYQVVSLVDRLGDHGLGWSIMSDRATGLNSKAFQLTYAYHFILKDSRKYNNNTYLSVGVSALAAIFINEEGFFENNATHDNTSSESDLSPNVNTGMYLYTNDYFIGISVARPFKYPYQSLSSVDGENRNTTHYFTMAGYKLYLKDRKSYIEPSFLTVIKRNSKIATDGSIKGSYKNKYSILLTHRMIVRSNRYNHYIVPAALLAYQSFEFGYSLDIPVVKNDPCTFFHHRFCISYTVTNRCNTRLKNCPAYW